MIFAIAGTQLPFPRLMNALDAIAGRHGLDILAQTADPGFSAVNIRTEVFLRGAAFDNAMAQARMIVAHAGIGAIMTAAELRKPMIIMPRRADLGEHRNDHQLATANRFADVPGLTVVHDEAALEKALLARDVVPVSFTNQGRVTSLISAVAEAVG